MKQAGVALFFLLFSLPSSFSQSFNQTSKGIIAGSDPLKATLTDMMTIPVFSKTHTSFLLNNMLKAPIVVEVNTKYTSMEEALMAAKNALLAQKFIAANGIQKSSFTSTRTTGSKADYYVADVTGTMVDGKVKLTISFVKIGTGFLKLQKVADAVKLELEK